MLRERSVLNDHRSLTVIGGEVSRGMIAEVSAAVVVAVTAESAVAVVRIAGTLRERSVSIAHRGRTAVIGGEVSSGMIAKVSAVTAENAVAALRSGGVEAVRSGSLTREGRGRSRAESALRARVGVVLRLKKGVAGDPKIDGGDGSCAPYSA